MRSRLLRTLAVALAVVLAYLLLWPSGIDPVAWEPPPVRPLTGPYAPNEDLRAATLFAIDQVHGPEDVEVDDEGRVYASGVDGRVARVLTDGSVEVFAHTGGRPLGIDLAPSGDLIVCDSERGLLSIAPDGAITTLATEAEGVPFRFTNDVDVARDGRIYFTDASDTFGTSDYLLEALESRPHGRLLRHDPEAGTTEVLLDGLYFANGVALSAAEDSVAVNETYRMRTIRYWLTGDRAGTHEVLADELPGYPDGLSRSPRGTLWVPLFTVRNPIADALAPHPFVRELVARLPRALWPKAEPYGFVIELGDDGTPLRSFQDPGGATLKEVSSVEEVDGSLYIGTLYDAKIGKLPL